MKNIGGDRSLFQYVGWAYEINDEDLHGLSGPHKTQIVGTIEGRNNHLSAGYQFRIGWSVPIIQCPLNCLGAKINYVNHGWLNYDTENLLCFVLFFVYQVCYVLFDYATEGHQGLLIFDVIIGDESLFMD